MRGRTDRAGLTRFLGALGRRMRRPVRLYLVGNTVPIDLGLRDATLAIDYVADADDPLALPELVQEIRTIMNELDRNAEPVSPGDFLPIPRSVLGRSRYVRQHGFVGVYYDHLPSQVIAKAARGLEQDFADAERLLKTGEVGWNEVADLWLEVRSSPTGWLRYEPPDVERRLEVIRRRLGRASC